ncbi:MAG: UvrB/UvrC motif-containing protein [Phycisphaerales bacterium]
MSFDLTKALQDWPFEPGQINVRLIQGDDERPKIQMRVDLGILQMEAEGRPDGGRPMGYDSLLEYQETRLEDHMSENGSEEGFALDAETCRMLREESVQYYHRYISLLVLEDYEAVVRDCGHNLRVLDLCAEFAKEDDDRAILEQFRPYLVMMRTRALASAAVASSEPKVALYHIEDGLEQMRQVFEEAGAGEAFEESHEAIVLRGMRDQLAPKLPVSQREELRKRLQEALRQENYELAAILRDELRLLAE